MLTVASPGRLLAALDAELAPDLEEVERILRRRTDSNLELVKLTGRYLYRSGGKRLRPKLLLLAMRAAGGDPAHPGATSFAAMVEVLHAATLVHDDIVDQADTRRGKPSLNNLLGDDLSVLIGDFLYIQSMSLAIEQGDLRVVRTLCDVTMRMVEGMLLEKARAGTIGLTRAEHLEILRLKTAWLFYGCGKMGAMIAGASPETEEAIAESCLNLGMAFQVADDLLDFTASADDLGKPVLSDLKEAHLTLPILHSLERAPDAVPLVEDVLRKGRLTPQSRRAILELVRREGGIGESRRMAEVYAQRAREALAPVRPSRYRDGFEALADYVIQRER